MKVKLHKINNEIVKPCLNIDQIDTRPVKGCDLFTEPYANIFLCAKKKSGKTMTTFHILKKCSNKETDIVVFSSTWEKDPVYENMRKYFAAKKINISGFDTLVENKQNLLDLILNSPAEEEPEQQGQKKPKNILDLDEVATRKKRAAKHKAPKTIIVLDDISDELKNPTLLAYLKKNRHYQTKFIISSQYYKDIPPCNGQEAN